LKIPPDLIAGSGFVTAVHYVRTRVSIHDPLLQNDWQPDTG